MVLDNYVGLQFKCQSTLS